VPIVLVGVTPHQGARESRAQGEVAQVVGCPGPARYARCGTPKPDWSLVERCSKATTGELLEIERLTSSLERGHWKSTRKGNSLVAYSTARTVLNGGCDMKLFQSLLCLTFGCDTTCCSISSILRRCAGR